MDLRKVFIKMNFIELYSQLSKKFCSNNDFMESVDLGEASKIFTDLGYVAKLFRKEKFFRINDQISKYTIWFHVCLKYGQVELMLYIKDGDTFLKPNGPFSWIPDQLDINLSTRISLPTYRNYNELREILVDSLNIYNIFLSELTIEIDSEQT